MNEEQWRAAVSHVFSGWTPDSKSVWEIIEALGAVIPRMIQSRKLCRYCWKMDPLLMGRVARGMGQVH